MMIARRYACVCRSQNRRSFSVVQTIRGTRDVFFEDAECSNHLIQQLSNCTKLYGYRPLATPIIEYTDLFARVLGASSDVVSKEMFTFQTRSGRSISLRPENTASVMRAVLQNGLDKVQSHWPLRFASWGPMFRYERPQKGRYRQFDQFNIECIGDASIEADVELIEMAVRCLDSIGLRVVADATEYKDVVLRLNSLGDEETRRSFERSLKQYYHEHHGELSPESRQRFERGSILRILDSKEERDIEINSSAPRIGAHYTASAGDRFETLLKKLEYLQVPYVLEEGLVRGLDYYNHSIFEFTSDSLGAQSTVLAGGRYDGLSETMGSKSRVPGIGWACGIDRIALLIDRSDVPSWCPTATIVTNARDVQCCDSFDMYVGQIAQHLRSHGISVVKSSKSGLKKQLRNAVENKSKYALIIGSSEFEGGSVTLRHLHDRTEQQLPLQEVVEAIASGASLPGRE